MLIEREVEALYIFIDVRSHCEIGTALNRSSIIGALLGLDFESTINTTKLSTPFVT